MNHADAIKIVTLSLALAVLSTPFLRAQSLDLPVIPDDPSVVMSTLPCGVKLYYVPNSSSKNLVNMALVQIPDSTMQADKLTEIARRSMEKAAYHNLPFEKFLASNGILPRRNGYFSTGGEIIYRLDSLSLARGAEVLDSVLYGVFKIAAEAARNGIPTSSQALMVAGDIYYDLLSERARILSIECPDIPGESHRKKYVWKEPEPGSWKMRVESRNVSKITAEWRDSRIPDKYMKTVLPVILRKMSQEFGWVLKSRLQPEFRRQGIYVWMDYRYVGSEDSRGDAVSSLIVYCAKTQTEKTRDIIARELDRLLTYGVEEEEYCYCRDAYKYSVMREETNPVQSNDKEIKKCISHYLCGASLATGKDVMKFEFREMPDSMQTRLFNNYVRKRLSAGSRVDSGLVRAPASVSRDSVRKVLAAYVPSLPVKVPKDKDEYFSGGRKWNLLSGPVAVHKKIVPGGLVHYCYAVKGGSLWADSDYLNCIDGVSAQTLSAFLAAIGAKMNVRITPVCVYFTGSVPEESFDTMVNVIAAISRQKENVQVFSSDRYKLFVTAGPMTYEQVKKTLAKYAGALGAGTDVAVGVDQADISEFEADGSSVIAPPSYALSTEFPLDMNSKNYALSKVARLILRDKVATALSGRGTARISCGFESFPEENYRIVITPSSENLAAELPGVLKQLASTPLDKETVGKYVKAAQDEFLIFKSTPQYYINGVVKRYIDFKDLYSDFDSQAKKIGAADLNAFFTAALENVR